MGKAEGAFATCSIPSFHLLMASGLFYAYKTSARQRSTAFAAIFCLLGCALPVVAPSRSPGTSKYLHCRFAGGDVFRTQSGARFTGRAGTSSRGCQ